MHVQSRKGEETEIIKYRISDVGDIGLCAMIKIKCRMKYALVV